MGAWAGSCEWLSVALVRRQAMQKAGGYGMLFGRAVENTLNKIGLGCVNVYNDNYRTARDIVGASAVTLRRINEDYLSQLEKHNGY